MGVLLDATQAAEVAGLSDRHMRRKLTAGEIPGAHKDGRGRWLVPEESAKAARVLSPPLTTEEKALIAKLKAEDEKTTAKEVAAKINKGRKKRGEEPTTKHSVDKVLREIRALEEPSENGSIEKPGTTPTRKQAVPSPSNPAGNASVPGSPGVENREARARNRGSTRIRVVKVRGAPREMGGFARISNLKQELGFSEEKTRDLFGLLNEATIGNHKFQVSDLRDRGFSEEEIRRLFAAFEDAAGDPHELPMREW